ncbi:DUF1338 family protein [Sphingomonas sp. PL-96]|uniref:2-oxoadipate dioxygenase/decarboxylase family protein n=1 Tax=Sphingomonas sp. PL-96 TaxID=2887201 RepID=UPI001E3237A5|nr:DUF1338 family protein [Sphingomonas sp. PL-96]MCC2975146.1 DUF1338 family protein [Sphingomonas sp. PL-96]
MRIQNDTVLARLVRSMLGNRTEQAFDTLVVPAELAEVTGDRVPRAVFAMALAAVLFDDLLARVPSGARYVADRRAAGERILFDHGALRTIRFPQGPTGALPAGQDAFARILEPLGYAVASLYPLPALKMTGHAYCHRDLPEAIPQYFVSELHVDRFDATFASAAARVFGSSRDPLTPADAAVLDGFARDGAVAYADAEAALPRIAAAFDRQHDAPAVADYETLLAQSGEAAWIATEGNAFNHATDRVTDVEALSDRLRDCGWPIKERVEISGSGRVRQTAFRADPVERSFVDAQGEEVRRSVPGSFYEFITRHPKDDGTLDLAFDSANATGIFAMTRAV